MVNWIALTLERWFNFPPDRTRIYLNRIIATGAAMAFVIVATLIVGFEQIFPGQSEIASLEVGDVTGENILAPHFAEYVSQVLTNQRQQEAAANVRPIYDPPDPTVSRQQSDLARQILTYIENIRRDAYATPEQHTSDLKHITALALSDLTISYILEISHERWQDLSAEIITVLERVMRSEIQDDDLFRVRAQLPNQVSIRFTNRESAVITAIVSDLIRPNTVLNETATEQQRDLAIDAVPNEIRTFQAGQIVVSAGSEITASDYEALEALGLLHPTESRQQGFGRAFLASNIIMVITGLYLARFQPDLLYFQPRFLTLLAVIFLVVLLGARVSISGEIYIYPTAAMALLYVAIVGPQVAIMGAVGLAVLVGQMVPNGLEITTLVLIGGITGALTLHRAERLNNFFFAGLIVAVTNLAVVILFNINQPDTGGATELLLLVIYSLINGLLTAAAAIAALYLVTQVLNLPTALKLAELSQPSQPLLQRLLREAPGTYQHSLQVANLAEQAVSAIGGNSQLTHVAALYHDIGKMENAAFFVENQRDAGNPHDALNDPQRSADIIVGHVTGGDELARQYHLPNRIRDFIREHHGTSQVYVFYKQAVIQAGDDESLVDSHDFSYPGPRPRSRETAVLMLADSCEAAVRSRQPKTRQEISETVRMVLDSKRTTGQLDDSQLTLNDLATVERIFIDMLQAIFHPRINYAEAVAQAKRGAAEKTSENHRMPPETATPPADEKARTPIKPTPTVETPVVTDTADDEEEDTPMPEVPRLRRNSGTNGNQKTPSIRDTQETEAES